MTLQEFVVKYTGKFVDFDGAFGPQCVDLINQYCVDVLSINNPIQILPGATAYTIYQNFGGTQFSKIANTPTGVPQAGDIIFWDPKWGAGAGHVAIFVSGDTNNFQSFEQNDITSADPNGSCETLGHDYTDVVGWLHPQSIPTTGTMYKGYDLTNQDSMKVAVDLLVQVQSGQFVPLADINAISTTLGLPAGSNKDAINAAIATLQKDKTADEVSLATVNKQIPELEGQISTLKNQVTSLEQQLQTAQDALKEPTSGLSYKDLYTQVEINLIATKAALATLTATTNRQIAQLQNTSATTMPFSQLWKIVFSRSLHLS